MDSTIGCSCGHEDNEGTVGSRTSIEEGRGKSLFARHGVLLVLTLVSTIANIDRNVLAILQESVKRDLNLSDGQLGLATGFAFALFYSILGLPLARIADRWSRRNLIAISLTLWSGLTALTGIAQNFSQLLMARFGVGVGEAGCNPPSYSLISDHYEPRHRSAAFGFYYTSSYLGLLFGFLTGGWLERVVGWRNAFVVIGAPGLAVALLLRILIKEPARTKPQELGRSFLQDLRFLLRQKTFSAILPAAIFNAIVPFGLIAWSAPLLIRVYHFSPLQAGSTLALSFGLGGMIGLAAAGALGNLLAVRDARWYLWLSAIVALADAFFLFGAYETQSSAQTMLLLLFPLTFSSIYGTMCLSVINGTVPSHLRATASAIFLLVANIFGQGIGVWLIGVVSDWARPSYGAGSIRIAMLAVIPAASFIAGLFYIRAARPLNRALSEWR